MTKAEQRAHDVTAALHDIDRMLRDSGRRRHEMCASIYHAGGGEISPREFGNDGLGGRRARMHLIRVCLDRMTPPSPKKSQRHGRAG